MKSFLRLIRPTRSPTTWSPRQLQLLVRRITAEAKLTLRTRPKTPPRRQRQRLPLSELQASEPVSPPAANLQAVSPQQKGRGMRDSDRRPSPPSRRYASSGRTVDS